MSERREDVAMAIHAVRISPPQFEPFPEDYALADAAIFAYEATHPEPTDAEVTLIARDIMDCPVPGQCEQCDAMIRPLLRRMFTDRKMSPPTERPATNIIAAVDRLIAATQAGNIYAVADNPDVQAARANLLELFGIAEGQS